MKTFDDAGVNSHVLCYPVRVLAASLVVLFSGCVPLSPIPSTSSAPAANVSPSATRAAVPTGVTRSGSTQDLILATTTSTQDSGLLDVLVPLFEKQTGYRVKTVSVGTGAALALGARGEADVALVHAPAAEKLWMAQGNGTDRRLVMHNDFVIVGPTDDPAKIRANPSAVDVLRNVAAAESPFVSRGDDSGTHQLERALWKQVGIEPRGQSWYVESGSGMGQTLTIADQKSTYTITDRATWLARQKSLPGLTLLVEGDRALFNVYHVMPVNPTKFPSISLNVAGGKAFADFLLTTDTQGVIGNFGVAQYGQSLFIPDGGKTVEEVGS